MNKDKALANYLLDKMATGVTLDRAIASIEPYYEIIQDAFNAGFDAGFKYADQPRCDDESKHLWHKDRNKLANDLEQS